MRPWLWPATDLSMEAFHSFWSAPNRCRNQGEILFPDYEQLTAILSALEWRRHSGKIRMITDRAGAACFREKNLTVFWNETEEALDSLDEVVDPFAFWAAGKLAALKTMTTPCVMLDTDLILWESVEQKLTADVVAAHAEALNPRTYPERSAFRMKNGYRFPENWDFRIRPANTAFLYIKNAGFRDAYVDAVFQFLENVETDGLTPVQTMCFAEQRILPMCAAAEGQTMAFLMEMEEVFRQDYTTHTWGFKNVLRQSSRARDGFCIRCVTRITRDFPEEAEMLMNCPDLRDYYLRVQDAAAAGAR